jgi:hypothetical protein
MTRVVGIRIHYIQTIFSVPNVAISSLLVLMVVVMLVVSIFSLVVVDSVTMVLADLVCEVTPKECSILDRVVLPSGKRIGKVAWKGCNVSNSPFIFGNDPDLEAPQSDNQAALSIN